MKNEYIAPTSANPKLQNKIFKELHKIANKKKHVCYFKRIVLKGHKKSKTVMSICSCKNTRYIREYDEDGILLVQIGLLI